MICPKMASTWGDYEIHGVGALRKVRLSHITNGSLHIGICPRRSAPILNSARS